MDPTRQSEPSQQLLPSIDLLLLQLRLKQFWNNRGLGQHFLTDPAILERIAAACDMDKHTLAVEIGPGPGTLTTLLAAQGGGVLGIEFDERLRPLHLDAFGRSPEVRFHYADALRVDLVMLAETHARELQLDRLVFTGNLPFQITSPLLFAQCGPGIPWQRICVMVQKEVADRIASPPGRRDYGILTVKLAYWWRVIERFEVSRQDFLPPPRVDASVLVLERRPATEHPTAEEWVGLSRFIDGAFGQKRKMLLNSLAARWANWQNREHALSALQQLGIDAQVRAEALTPEQLRKVHALLGA